MKLLIFQNILTFSEKIQLDDSNNESTVKEKKLGADKSGGPPHIFSAGPPGSILVIWEVKHPSGRITQQTDQCSVFLRGYLPADHRSGSSPESALY